MIITHAVQYNVTCTVTASQKGKHCTLDRFQKFFHCDAVHEICNELVSPFLTHGLE